MSGKIVLPRVRQALITPPSELERGRRAAVALVLSPAIEDAGLSVLLVRRAEREGDPWSGHMAFPGGHEHPEDPDLLHTARRETLEEVGIDLTGAELLGRLDDVSPLRAELTVRPFVFWSSIVPDATLSAEVAETLWVPLDALATDGLKSLHEVEVRGARMRVPAYVIGARVVWGMTYYLLERFLAQVARAA